jgi:hypothetical protein
MTMAYCRTQLAVPLQAQDLDRLVPDLIRRLGLDVEESRGNAACRVGTDRPHRGLSAREHVVLLCDWSNLSNTGEVAIETRSGESMAHTQTRAQLVLQEFCGCLQHPGWS